MDLERISVAIRPRSEREAIDLGLHMVQAHARAIYPPWAIVVLASAAFLAVALPGHPLIAVLLFWLGLPIYDRIVVHVLSKALFGDEPDWRETLASLPSLLRTLSLNPLNRIDFTRSFNLPVIQLEALRPSRRTRRIGTLQRRVRGDAVALSAAFLVIQLVLLIGLLTLGPLLLPEGMLGKLSVDLGGSVYWDKVAPWLFAGAYVLVILFLEPFYVGAGFSLYLNRRAMLEGWDLEIGLRGMAQRIRGAAGVACVCFALFAVPAWLPDAQAADTSASRSGQPLDASQPLDESAAPEVIAKVLAQPVFGHEERFLQWRYIGGREKEKAPESLDPSGFLDWLFNSMLVGSAFAKVMRALLWLLVIAALAWLVWRRDRWLHLIRWRGVAATPEAPIVVAGMDVTPESLPADIPRAVRTLWNQGHHREAMSTLYRGTLAALVERKHLKVDASCTEQDCIDAVERLETPDVSRHFRDLTTLWQLLAYGHRLPETRVVEMLCRQWFQLYGEKP